MCRMFPLCSGSRLILKDPAARFHPLITSPVVGDLRIHLIKVMMSFVIKLPKLGGYPKFILYEARDSSK